MISRTGSYALRILSFLAEQPPGMVRTSRIAFATGVPANYLCKILSQLRKGGLVEGRKGWGGGFALVPRARRVALEEVLAIIAGPTPEMSCFLDPARFGPASPCHLHRGWEMADEGFRHFLASTTIADLAPRGGRL